jgi:hypothetical protein
MIASTKAARNFPDAHIVNLNESNWRLGMANKQIAGQCRVEGAHNYTDGDPETNFSLFASICVDGRKLPLILIAEKSRVAISSLAIKSRNLIRSGTRQQASQLKI